MEKVPDIVEELERVNVLFYIDRGETFQKGDAVVVGRPDRSRFDRMALE